MRKRKDQFMKCITALIVSAVALSGCGADEVQNSGKSESDNQTKQSESSQGIQEQSSSEQVQQSSENDSGNLEQTEGLKEILESWDFDYGYIKLDQAVDRLDQNNIHYIGYYNVSGERLDMTLEDGTQLIFLETRDSEMQPAGYELMMKGAEFNKNGFQENYLNAYDVITDEYYYPDLMDKKLEEGDLWKLNQTDMSILRNQIYAKYGREFQDIFLDAVFKQKSWYAPEYSASEFDAGQQKKLTDLEQNNLELLRKVEEARGYRSTGAGDYSTAKGLMSGSWIDLDGDGEKEQVYYTTVMEDEDNFVGKMTLQVRKTDRENTVKETSAELEELNLHPNCYVVTQDGKTWKIIVASNGPSSDYSMSFYNYNLGKLEKLGVINSYVESLKVYPDKMLAMVETFHLECQRMELEYTIENEALKWVEKDYYKYAETNATVLKDIILYAEKDSKNTVRTLKAGDEIVVLGGDLSQWVQLEVKSTGEKGWIKVIDGECDLADGSTETSSLCFSGLIFYD